MNPELNLGGDHIGVAAIGAATAIEAASKIMGLTLNEWFYVVGILYGLFYVIDKGVDIYKKGKYKTDWSLEDDRIRHQPKDKNDG